MSILSHCCLISPTEEPHLLGSLLQLPWLPQKPVFSPVRCLFMSPLMLAVPIIAPFRAAFIFVIAFTAIMPFD